MYELPPPMVCPTLSGPLPWGQVGPGTTFPNETRSEEVKVPIPKCHRCGCVGHVERYCPALSGPFPGDQVGPGTPFPNWARWEGSPVPLPKCQKCGGAGHFERSCPPCRDLFPGPGLDQGPPSRTSLNQQHRPVNSNNRRIAHSPSRRPAGEERGEATATAHNSRRLPPCSDTRHPPGPGQSILQLRDRHAKDSQSMPCTGRR